MRLTLGGLVEYALIRQSIHENKNAGILPAPYLDSSAVSEKYYTIFTKQSFAPVYKSADCFSLFIKKNITYGGFLDKTLGAIAIVRVIAFMDVLIRMQDTTGNINYFKHWAKDIDAWEHSLLSLVDKLPLSLKEETLKSVKCLKPFLMGATHFQKEIQSNAVYNIQKVTQILTNHEGFTPLISYAIACDLYKSGVLAHANDFDSWCNIGPEAGKVVKSLVLNSEGVFSDAVKDHFLVLHTHSVSEQRLLCQKALTTFCMLINRDFWPQRLPRLTLHDLERLILQYNKFVNKYNSVFGE